MRALRPNQRDALRYTFGVTHPALFMEMRLGKTLVAIRRIKTYRNSSKILVVGPYSVLAGWEDDLRDDGEQHIFNLTGTSTQRSEKLQSIKWMHDDHRSWVLMNKEGWMSTPQIAGIFWDVVVMDESIVIKNPSAMITEFFLKYFRRVPHRWILCGTPAPENELDYITQLNFIDPSILRSSYYRMRAKYFRPADRDPHSFRMTEEGKAFLATRLAKSCFFQSRAQVHMGGVKIRERRMIQLPAAIRKAYNTVEQEFVLELEGQLIDKTIFASQKYIWLKRLCGGWLPDETSTHKVDELLSLFNGEMKGQQAVVWCQFIWEIDLVVSMLPGSAAIHGGVSQVEREKRRQLFQAGQLQYAVIQPETMKFGSKWTAADALVYYSSPESATAREQSEDRSLDVSTKDNVLIIDMPCEDTVEEDVLMNLLWKDVRSDGMERLVKSIQKRQSK
jgi:hypothetical protein